MINVCGKGPSTFADGDNSYEVCVTKNQQEANIIRRNENNDNTMPRSIQFGAGFTVVHATQLGDLDLSVNNAVADGLLSFGT